MFAPCNTGSSTLELCEKWWKGVCEAGELAAQIHPSFSLAKQDYLRNTGRWLNNTDFARVSLPSLILLQSYSCSSDCKVAPLLLCGLRKKRFLLRYTSSHAMGVSGITNLKCLPWLEKEAWLQYGPSGLAPLKSELWWFNFGSDSKFSDSFIVCKVILVSDLWRNHLNTVTLLCVRWFT